MIEAFPIWVLALDYVLGMIMWTLIGRFGMGLFLPEDSSFFFMRFFVRVTDPLLRLFSPVTPGSSSGRWCRCSSRGSST